MVELEVGCLAMNPVTVGTHGQIANPFHFGGVSSLPAFETRSS